MHATAGNAWEVRVEIQILNPDLGEDDETRRADSLLERVVELGADDQAPWPTSITRSDDEYVEVSFLVDGADRLGAFDQGLTLIRGAIGAAELDPGQMRMHVRTLDEADNWPEDDDDASDAEGVEIEELVLRPDDRYASAWFVDDPFARGALKLAASVVLDEVQDAILEVRRGAEPGGVLFGDHYLPDGFMHAYDERFLERLAVCIAVMGYKLAQVPAIPAACLAEEFALNCIRLCALEILEENEVSGGNALLDGLWEVGQDDDVLDLYDMQEPGDAALALSDLSRCSSARPTCASRSGSRRSGEISPAPRSTRAARWTEHVFGSAIDVTNLDRDAVKAARARLRLSQAETARRMYAYVKANGPGHEGSVALSGDGFGWVSESACRRAVSDLENGKRYIKEVQYVDSMLAVLGLTRDEIGLVDAKVY